MSRLTAPTALATLAGAFTLPANEVRPWNARNALVWALFIAGVFLATLAVQACYRLVKGGAARKQ